MCLIHFNIHEYSCFANCLDVKSAVCVNGGYWFLQTAGCDVKWTHIRIS